jgi:NTE family protein
MQYKYAGNAIDPGIHAKRLARGTRLMRGAVRRVFRHVGRHRSLSLALQGGGSFGAFTWGVLDRLLEKDHIAFDTISGSSAGAVNAVLFASGLVEGGPVAARAKLDRFWRRIGKAGMLGPFGSFGRSMAASAARAALAMSGPIVSPYQFNPLGLNPLRDILAEEVDFARLRDESPVELLIAATRVRDGSLRLFRNHEITLDVVLASACLPHLHHAVEIEDEWYWDGGFSANPPLRQLALDSRTPDVLLVQIMPEGQGGLPRFSPHIARRVNEMAFNFPLQKEVEALDEMCALCKKAGFFRPRFCLKLERLRLHRIVAEEAMPELRNASAANLDWNFLQRLKKSGGSATERWLADFRRK